LSRRCSNVFRQEQGLIYKPVLRIRPCKVKHEMTTVKHPEPNTTVARLHISLNGTYNNKTPENKKQELTEYIKQWTQAQDTRPSGATLIEGTGLWFPENPEKHEVENNIIIEIWIDNPEELEEIQALKTEMENTFNQHCICLSLEDRYYEH